MDTNTLISVPAGPRHADELNALLAPSSGRHGLCYGDYGHRDLLALHYGRRGGDWQAAVREAYHWQQTATGHWLAPNTGSLNWAISVEAALQQYPVIAWRINAVYRAVNVLWASAPLPNLKRMPAAAVAAWVRAYTRPLGTVVNG